ncbi:phosphatidylcholine:ceramide cholinephosphotransferase 1-like [Tropilaelaps mercedesae]|uniref:Phosphatidylcholine:ceramide cholinephosphotransferase 1-like n=1 Tax=Tropilaelaps mercedesae TaxID=418985 RepID=A0A1V9X3R7_9ACAR|nr:phosphatidylcholine:ceramide cholinephosphotransferase 1-like [Tropilaelaps mercedesae]
MNRKEESGQQPQIANFDGLQGNASCEVNRGNLADDVTNGRKAHLASQSALSYLCRVWWFPFFRYFEANVTGPVPRQYEWPLPEASTGKSERDQQQLPDQCVATASTPTAATRYEVESSRCSAEVASIATNENRIDSINEIHYLFALQVERSTTSLRAPPPIRRFSDTKTTFLGRTMGGEGAGSLSLADV